VHPAEERKASEEWESAQPEEKKGNYSYEKKER